VLINYLSYSVGSIKGATRATHWLQWVLQGLHRMFEGMSTDYPLVKTTETSGLSTNFREY